MNLYSEKIEQELLDMIFTSAIKNLFELKKGKK